MKSTLLLTLLLGSIRVGLAAPIGTYQHGTVVRMHMGACMLMHGTFMSRFGPPQAAAVEERCPEYTLMSDKVVFVIVGKSSNQLVPLAEVIDFRLANKESAVRVDDARSESKFAIKEMTLRSEWDLIQTHSEQEPSGPPQQSGDTTLAARRRQ